MLPLCSAVCAQLRTAVDEGLTTQKAALQFIGRRFRLKAELPDWVSEEVVTKEVIRCGSPFLAILSAHVHTVYVGTDMCI